MSRRRALAALLLVAPAPSIGAAAALWWWPGAAGNAVYSLCKFVLYGAPLAWRLFVDREPLSLSLPRKGGFGVGIALGLAIGAFIWAVFARLAERIDPQPLRAALEGAGLDEPARYLLFAIYLATANAALEEYAFRWFVQSRFAVLAGGPVSVPGAALVFTAHHVVVLLAYFEPRVALPAAAGVFAGGLAWSWCYRRYESIWPGWASHALVDAAIFAIGWRLLFAA